MEDIADSKENEIRELEVDEYIDFKISSPNPLSPAYGGVKRDIDKNLLECPKENLVRSFY